MPGGNRRVCRRESGWNRQRATLCPQEEITRASSFVDDLKADSLDVVELVMEFEDEFEITIPDDDYEKIRTVGDAITYIEEKS